MGEDDDEGGVVVDSIRFPDDAPGRIPPLFIICLPWMLPVAADDVTAEVE